MRGHGGRTARRLCVALAAVAAPAALLAAEGHAEDAGARSGSEWMHEGYVRKAARDAAGAAAAFRAARAIGFEPQRADLELAFLSLGRGDTAAARRQLEAAALGPDPQLADRARSQLRFVPGRTRGDLYADAYGWRGLSGDAHPDDAVPTVRLRAHYRPWLGRELSLYLFLQATRDLASRGGALPRTYADNAALVGPGILLRLWDGRGGLFLQGGAAFGLVDDGRARTAFDARGGGYLGLESAGCAPRPARGARLELRGCAELYTEAVWLSRFDDDVVAFGRGRTGVGWLVTGPVAWQLVLEARGAANRERRWGDDFAEAGAWHRWRLLRSLRVDALVGVSTGRTLEVAGKAPARPGSYTELRFQLVTTAEL